MTQRLREIVEAECSTPINEHFTDIRELVKFRAERVARRVLEEACNWLKTDFADTPRVAQVNGEAAINGLRAHFGLGDGDE